MNESAERSAGEEPAWETVCRVVYPIVDQDQTLPLYLARWTRPHLTADVMDVRVALERFDPSSLNEAGFGHAVREGLSNLPSELGYSDARVLGRTALEVSPGVRVTTCAYFNAFPASYWRRWTRARRVRFTAHAEGEGEVVLYRSTGRGLIFEVCRHEVSGSADLASEIEMHGLLDGGFYWFDVAATGSALVVSDACWQVEAACRRESAGSLLSVAITTFNRPSYCLRQLRTIAGDATLRARLDTVFCVDQGTDLVSATPGFREVSRDLDVQLTYLRQGNLGGSGGFSRGMYEAVRRGSSAYVLLLDDDAVSEPEAILRSVQFADYASAPTIVGGGMLHLDNRTVLHAQGEMLDEGKMWMFPPASFAPDHDFATFPLALTPALHKRFDVDFNGWWMCLVPCEVIRTIGLSLPVFIKFDDIEYAMRAREHGFRTVSLPGVAVWHQAWHDKDPGRSWEEYFTNRNRWLAALLHEDAPSRTLALEFARGDANLGIRLLYSAVRIRQMGVEDLLKGPDYLVGCLRTKLGEVREARAAFCDAQARPGYDAYPEPRRQFVSPEGRPLSGSEKLRSGLAAVASSLLGRRTGAADERPDVAIPARDFRWRSLVGVSSALVTTADGDGVCWVRRDDRQFRRGIVEGLRLARELSRRWGELSRAYRSYGLASMETWEAIFSEEDGRGA